MSLLTLDVDKLIADIAVRPAIWDKTFNSRHNKSFLEDTWEELAEIHNAPSKTLKAKWKSLRDNFRIQWKMIPRCENDELLISPEEFTGTKWQYYKQLLFLADNMMKTRTKNSTINDDQNCDLFQLFESSNEMPDKLSIALYQQQLQQQYPQQIPKLKEMVEVKQLIEKTQLTSAPKVHYKKQHHPQSSSTSFDHKRKRLDEVTTSNGEKSFSTASGLNLPNSSNDDDYYFIMSLKPYLHQFSGPQKLKVQMRIQKLLFQELYKQDIDVDYDD